MVVKKRTKKSISKPALKKIIDEIEFKLSGIKHGSIVTEEIKKLKELVK